MKINAVSFFENFSNGFLFLSPFLQSLLNIDRPIALGRISERYDNFIVQVRGDSARLTFQTHLFPTIDEKLMTLSDESRFISESVTNNYTIYYII